MWDFREQSSLVSLISFVGSFVTRPPCIKMFRRPIYYRTRQILQTGRDQFWEFNKPRVSITNKDVSLIITYRLSLAGDFFAFPFSTIKRERKRSTIDVSIHASPC